jgi:hypothetical protein
MKVHASAFVGHHQVSTMIKTSLYKALVYLVSHVENPYQLHRTITGYYDQMPLWHILGTIQVIIEKTLKKWFVDWVNNLGVT